MSPEEFLKTQNVSRETFSRLQTYHDLLVKWQKAINLVSPNTLNDIWGRHFTDSAQLAGRIPQGAKVADLGSGAGFPGLVLAILRPDLEIHLIESDGRKCEFLKNVSRETFSKVMVHNERVEKILGQVAPDIITARALASVEDLLGMVPESSKNAQLLLLKGKSWREEIELAKKKFQFEVQDFPSISPEGRILQIKFT